MDCYDDTLSTTLVEPSHIVNMLAGTVPTTDEEVVNAVNDAYSSMAREGTHPECKQYIIIVSERRFSLEGFLLDAEAVAEAFGYTAEQLKSIPAESHMGLSCGNPVAMASIKEACSLRLMPFIFNDVHREKPSLT